MSAACQLTRSRFGACLDLDQSGPGFAICEIFTWLGWRLTELIFKRSNFKFRSKWSWVLVLCNENITENLSCDVILHLWESVVVFEQRHWPQFTIGLCTMCHKILRNVFVSTEWCQNFYFIQHLFLVPTADVQISLQQWAFWSIVVNYCFFAHWVSLKPISCVWSLTWQQTD